MQKHITAVGEVLFDIYGTKKVFGGAPFNFIYHINKFGINSDFVTAIGDDNDGNDISKFLQDQNMSLEYVKILPSISTGKVMVRLDKDKMPEYHIKKDVAYDYIELTEQEIDKILSTSTMIYFGTLCQRNETSRNTILSLLKVKKLNFCDINIRQNFYNKEIVETSLQLTDILKISKDELNVVNDLCFEKNLTLTENVKRLQDKYDISYIAVTEGEDGASLFSMNENVKNKPPKVDVLDTLGAGDAYSAMLAIGIQENISIDKINELAVLFAGDVCRFKGALPQSQEIYDNYREKIVND